MWIYFIVVVSPSETLGLWFCLELLNYQPNIGKFILSAVCFGINEILKADN